MLTKKLVNPRRIFGGEWRLKRELVIQQMIMTPLVALIDQRLKVQDNIGIRSTQGDARLGSRSRKLMG